MTDVPVAVLENDKTIVYGPEANAIYNRGYYGETAENKLILNGFEALHLFELGRITINLDDKPLTEHEIVVHYSSLTDEFMSRYLVYKDLRNRGYIVNQGKGSSFFFRLYERGSIPRKDSAKYYVTPLQEGNSIELSALSRLIKVSRQSRKILVFGMVDAIGDVSYLKVTQLEPSHLDQNKVFSSFDDWNWENAWQEYETWDN